MITNSSRPLIIAGPCSAEDREQVINTADGLKQLGIAGFRACLWKPRTKPGFDGVGSIKGIPWLSEVAKKGLIVSTEVLLAEHAEDLVKNLVRKNPNSKYIFWIGARNQNHLIQTGIARVLKNEPSVYLMAKNQIWRDEKHWLGIFEHILATGFPKERLLICHRGFMPNGHNPLGLRNVPDFEMAMKVKTLTGLPMIIDPSHIGGEVNKVLTTIDQSLKYDFDGFIIEVHPNPKKALTDAGQQLTISELSQIIGKIV